MTGEAITHARKLRTRRCSVASGRCHGAAAPAAPAAGTEPGAPRAAAGASAALLLVAAGNAAPLGGVAVAWAQAWEGVPGPPLPPLPRPLVPMVVGASPGLLTAAQPGSEGHNCGTPWAWPGAAPWLRGRSRAHPCVAAAAAGGWPRAGSARAHCCCWHIALAADQAAGRLLKAPLQAHEKRGR